MLRYWEGNCRGGGGEESLEERTAETVCFFSRSRECFEKKKCTKKKWNYMSRTGLRESRSCRTSEHHFSCWIWGSKVWILVQLKPKKKDLEGLKSVVWLDFLECILSTLLVSGGSVYLFNLLILINKNIYSLWNFRFWVNLPLPKPLSDTQKWDTSSNISPPLHKLKIWSL